ncbi:hypothetical protein LVJ82_05685 [Vitreoscilla massiliensis]|uniref:Uncharacterized protein n=1 Tax=Vitreoscilla massiliensis TaxID=1689272 RepID=A0ABY4E4N8_9NEIS|nr:hypothetical protein [Vitreoscilla massiliensis]UOO90464.1 hypothetical protein LVJ82_05685 [Vitreoscilla massiliensis]
MTFSAFADDSSSYTLANLTLENNGDSVSIYGDIQIARDAQGLQQLLELQHIINQAVATLQADAQLPEQLAAAPVNEIDNPFLS